MRMKKIYLILSGLFSLYLIGCNVKSEKAEFVLDSSIQSVLDSFVSIDPGHKIYELFIDKIEPDKVILFLSAAKKPLTERENIIYGQSPLITVYAQGIPVRIFLGAERYIHRRNQKFGYKDSIIVSDSKKKASQESHDRLWVVIDSCNVLTIYKNGEGAYPFFPLPVLDRSPFPAPVFNFDVDKGVSE